LLTPTGPNQVFRNRQAAIIQAVAGVVAFLATAPPALAASKGDHTALVVFKVVFVSLATALLVLALRGALSAIRVVDRGVRIVNPLSTRTFSWDEISEFKLARWRILPRVCFVVLKDGRMHHAWGISGRNPAFARHDPRAEGPVAELNALLQAARR
jgi:hypothetical protein